jgi:ubiquinone/menaquinone biosynthesis C-methylase UbiE
LVCILIFINRALLTVCLGFKQEETLHDENILDIGCGRGGGLAFLSKYYKPRLAVGLDFSSQQVGYSQLVHDEIENISFFKVSRWCPFSTTGGSDTSFS